MNQRLIDTLPVKTLNEIAKEGTGGWIPASQKAMKDKITVATIYNRIKKGEIQAINLEGRIYVQDTN